MAFRNQSDEESFIAFAPGDYEIAIKHTDLLMFYYHVPTKTMTVPQHIAILFGCERIMPNMPDSMIDAGIIIDNLEEYRRFFAEIDEGVPYAKARAALRLAAGGHRWMEAMSTTVYDDQGAPLYGVITTSDVTELREKELSYEKWHAAIQAQLSECIHYYDHNLSADVLESINGQTVSEYSQIYDARTDKTFTPGLRFVSERFIHPEDRDGFLKDFSRELLLEKYRNNETELKSLHRWLSDDGKWMWIQRITQLYNDPYNNNVHGLFMIKKLDNSYTRLQAELQTDVYDLINQSIPGGIVGVYDRPGFPVYHINEHMLRFLDYSHDEFIATTGGLCMNFIHPDDLTYVAEECQKARENNVEFELRYRLLKKDGSVCWVIDHGRYSTDQDGNTIMTCIYTDITEIISLQEELTQAAKTAEEATKMKSLFLANMSHEIRTPMNGILGFVELALDEESLPVSTREYLKKIKFSATGLLTIINDILDISKIEAGKMEVEHITFNLHDIFTHCETVSRLRAEEKGIALYFYSEPFVWQKLLGDPTKLSQILLNLLSNAIKFTEKGYVKLEAILESSSDKTVTIRFTVRDNGIGMTATELKRVFDPFSQADNSTTRKYGGTGLGLTITRNMIALMGGELHVNSSPGDGSTFSFSLTFETTEEAAITAANPAPAIQKPRFTGEVLVCEDNAINQQVIIEHLGRIGLTPLIAENGQIGVEMVTGRIMEGKPYDLILMDIHMPVMDGIEATHKMLSLGITTPIIALTANAMKKDRESYLALGMSDYISKPFYAQELWACLLKYLTPLELLQESGQLKSIPTASPSAINTALGLEHAANDDALYLHLKKNFYTDNRNKYDELAQSIQSKDWTGARRIAHSLKSNAGWIGATALANAAAEAEMVLSDGLSCSPALLEHIRLSLDQVLLELSPDLAGNGPNTRTAATLRLQPTQLIQILEPLIQEGNAECMNYLNEIRDVFADFAPYGDTLHTQIANYDFQDAAPTLRVLKNFIL